MGNTRSIGGPRPSPGGEGAAPARSASGRPCPARRTPRTRMTGSRSGVPLPSSRGSRDDGTRGGQRGPPGSEGMVGDEPRDDGPLEQPGTAVASSDARDPLGPCRHRPERAVPRQVGAIAERAWAVPSVAEETEADEETAGAWVEPVMEDMDAFLAAHPECRISAERHEALRPHVEWRARQLNRTATREEREELVAEIWTRVYGGGGGHEQPGARPRSPASPSSTTSSRRTSTSWRGRPRLVRHPPRAARGEGRGRPRPRGRGPPRGPDCTRVVMTDTRLVDAAEPAGPRVGRALRRDRRAAPLPRAPDDRGAARRRAFDPRGGAPAGPRPAPLSRCRSSAARPSRPRRVHRSSVAGPAAGPR